MLAYCSGNCKQKMLENSAEHCAECPGEPMAEALISCETDIDRCTVDSDCIWVLRMVIAVGGLRGLFCRFSLYAAVHRATPCQAVFIVLDNLSVIYICGQYPVCFLIFLRVTPRRCSDG